LTQAPEVLEKFHSKKIQKLKIKKKQKKTGNKDQKNNPIKKGKLKLQMQ